MRTLRAGMEAPRVYIPRTEAVMEKYIAPLHFTGAGTGEFLLHGGGYGEVSSDGEFLLVFL